MQYILVSEGEITGTTPDPDLCPGNAQVIKYKPDTPLEHLYYDPDKGKIMVRPAQPEFFHVWDCITKKWVTPMVPIMTVPPAE